jgi:hypothetical protein
MLNTLHEIGLWLNQGSGRYKHIVNRDLKNEFYPWKYYIIILLTFRISYRFPFLVEINLYIYSCCFSPCYTDRSIKINLITVMGLKRPPILNTLNSLCPLYILFFDNTSRSHAFDAHIVASVICRTRSPTCEDEPRSECSERPWRADVAI